MHNRTSFCHPSESLLTWALFVTFAKAKGKPRVAAELFALLGVVVRSGSIGLSETSLGST